MGWLPPSALVLGGGAGNCDPTLLVVVLAVENRLVIILMMMVMMILIVFNHLSADNYNDNTHHLIKSTMALLCGGIHTCKDDSRGLYYFQKFSFL